MAYSWQSDIIRPDGENGTEVLDTNGVYQPQIEGGDNITIEDGKISASGTLENVQADYTETDTSAPSYIKHKPDLSIYATASGMETELAGKQDVIEDLSTIRSGAEAGSTAVQPGDLATVATTGSYTSLTNTPQNIVQDASYVHTDNNFTNADKGKLDGIAAGAEVNVQSNWNETDPNSDAYIANKPTIPAAQQNADWNASSGVTAILNKPDLSAYATDTELANGLATKQNIISDLDSIRAGAAAGATAAQPSDLPSSDELVPSATSSDSGKVLTVDAQGNPGWVTPSAGTVYTPGDGIDITSDVISADVDGVTIGIDASTKKIKSLQTIPSVDQTYSASSTNAQSGTAVAGAIAGVKQVPASTSADQNKVLTVNSSGNAVWQNAQTTTYTAGTGVKIANNEISADLEVVQPCLTFGSDFKFDNATQYRSTLSNNTRVSIPYNTACKFTLPGNLPSTIQTGMYGGTLRLQIVDSNGTVIQTLKSQSYSMSYMNVPIPENFYKDVDIPAVDNGYLRWQWLTTASTELTVSNFDSTAYCFVVPYSGTLALTAPLPASTSADANKVLTVDSNGAAGWQTPSSSYTAGDGIDIDNGEISAKLDDDTLDLIQKTVETTYTGTTSTATGVASVPAAVASAFMSQTPVSIKVHIPVDTFSISRGQVTAGRTVNLFVRDNLSHKYISDVAVSTTDSGKRIYVDEQDIVVSSPASSWAYASGTVTKVTGVGFEVVENGGTLIDSLTPEFNNRIVTYTVTQVDQTQKSIAVKNPLPASAQADSGKVLTVNSSGAAVWQNVPTPSVDEVPDVTSSDDGKILTASYSGGVGSYSWQTGSQVDIKTEVVGGVTATTTTTNTFEVDIPYDTTNVAYVILKVSDSAVGDLGFSSNELSNVYPVLIDPRGSTYIMSDYLFPTEAAPSGSTYNRLVLGEHTTTKSITIEINDGARSFLQRNDGGKLRLAYGDNVAGYVDTNLTSGLTVTLATPDAEQVVSEINDMKLKPGVPYPYTAGITDIQVVSSLPASPVATVLYLVPET